MTKDNKLMTEKKKQVDKEFGLSSWAINNKATIYVVMILIFILGISAFNNMPRENFPEIKDKKVYVSTIYPGNTAEDVEKLITTPLEDRLKNISNVSKITSTSQEDYSAIEIEFEGNITIDQAKQKVKDEISQETAQPDWATFNDAKVEPNVFELNIAEETPIMNINVTGNYPTDKLKTFAEYLQDKIEDLPEIKKADIRGAEDKEVEVAVDIYKMMAAQVSFNDVLQAIGNGNITISGGNIINSGQRRNIRVVGEIDKPDDLLNFVVKSEFGNSIYLKDIATVSFKDVDKTTYARKKGAPVVMLDVKKRSGQNMIVAAEKIEKIVKEAENKALPKDVKVSITNDQSSKTLGQVDDLVNNIVFGVILVIVVLMFFLGLRNALFVGFAIPMSMFMSLMILNLIGYTMNTMILFGLIMGLGMLVDNGIVVVENVFRLMDEEGMSRIEAAKKGIGEIAFPIIISTATTVAAFIPLALWPGVMGQFMKYFPITLSAVLGSSLVVAIFFNSVLVSQFMAIKENKMPIKNMIITSSVVGVIGILIIIFGGSFRAIGTIMLVTAVMMWVYRYVLTPWVNWFQYKMLPRWERFYEWTLTKALNGWMPGIITAGTVIMLFVTFFIFGNSMQSKRTKVEFFPDNTPNQIIVYVEYPEGTDIEKTNAIMKDIESRVYKILDDEAYKDGDYNFLVESVVAQVGAGSGNPQTDGGSTAEMPNRGKITASMREYKFRRGADSKELKRKVTEAIKGIYPGITISVEKDPVGPPAGYPINIELKGDDYAEMIETAEKMVQFINSKSIDGIDNLKVDVNKSKPSLLVSLDRKKIGALGLSAAQVGSQIRNSIFGGKAGVYKEDGEDYDIYVRFNEENRYNKNAIFDQSIVFRDMNSGGIIKSIPVSAVTTSKNTSSFSKIKHKNNKRVVSVYSALAPGYTDAGAIVAKIQEQMKSFEEMPKEIEVDYTGQIEEQTKQQNFLATAFIAGLGLIFLILILQFNSISKPTIIMLAIFLSLIGVFGGILITAQPFVIMMTMMGIISLAGIVVNNGVVLLDYTQLLIDRKKALHNYDDNAYVNVDELKEAIVKGGKARLRPVLLTAITTILGLIPLAIGLNIDFGTLLTEFNPHIYMGGDNVVFWGPLAWAVIYGLIIATFLTLVVVPALFYLITRLKMWIWKDRVAHEAS